MSVAIARDLTPFLALALARLQTLHPNIAVNAREDDVTLAGGDADELVRVRQDLLHLLYQEKIYEDGREIRQTLFARLLGA